VIQVEERHQYSCELSSSIKEALKYLRARKRDL